MAARKAIDVQREVSKLIAAAAKVNDTGNLFFETTLKRYQAQLEILDRLKQEIDAGGTMVEKVSGGGVSNMVVNPAIADYNKTASAANNTASTLIAIVAKMGLEAVFADKDKAGDVTEDEL